MRRGISFLLSFIPHVHGTSLFPSTLLFRNSLSASVDRENEAWDAEIAIQKGERLKPRQGAGERTYRSYLE
jgi:hypothetical protein